MLVTQFHYGAGIGNQLWVYAVTRILAERKKTSFGIIDPEKFKGKYFIKMDLGEEIKINQDLNTTPSHLLLPEGIVHYINEKTDWHSNFYNTNLTFDDENIINCPDNSKLDGSLQSYEYLKQDSDKIKNWFEIDSCYQGNCNFYSIFSDNNICIIHIRGGDYSRGPNNRHQPDEKYYRMSMDYFKKINPNINFYIVTDDPSYSRHMLPEIPFIGSITTGLEDKTKASHHIGGPIEIDFNILLHAKNLIIPASSFSWWAAWLNKNKPIVVAPKYWEAHKYSNGFWARGNIATSEFLYLDKEGKIYNYDKCKKEQNI